MSSNDGQSLIPYPWPKRKKFNDSRRLISPIVRVLRVLMYVATFLSPPSLVALVWCKFGFRLRNDSWSKRGLVTVVVGALGIVLFSPNPMAIIASWDTLLRSFGPDSTLDVRDSLIDVVLVALPYSLVVHGLYGLARSFQIERTTSAFLRPAHPTVGMRWKRRKNIRQLKRGVDPHREGGYVRFGVIEDDRIPWRASRWGTVVERKIERMGHGVFIGSNGTGKTKAAESFSNYVLQNDGAIIYLDFKASLSAMRGLAAVARANDQPCYILDIGFGSTDTSWYDLFAWPGTPAGKASVLIECLQFPQGEGGVSFYRGIAQAWLPMQIEAADLVGLREGEGMFDFLLDTAVPMRFKDRIEPLRDSSDPALREKYERWQETASLRKAADLDGLRSELTKIIDAAGERLKPNRQNPNPVSMKEVMDNGGMVYIGIASGINDVVVKVLGSFLFRELSILVSERSRVPDTGKLRDVFVIPDEASEMEERSVMMNPIYTMAREARIFLWPSFQSFAVWDESTKKEIQSNARNFVAFSIPERETAADIAETIPDVYALKEMSEEQTKQQAFQEQTIGISGDARLEVVIDSFLRPHIELSQVPRFHAYIWFKDAPGISRDKWRGRRRVKKDQISGDAPLVKLIPCDLVMPENDDPNTAVYSDVPDTVESTVLPDPEGEHNLTEGRGAQASPSPTASAATRSGSDDGWWVVHAPQAMDDPPPPEDEAPPEEVTPRETTEPPSLPSWSSPAGRKEGPSPAVRDASGGGAPEGEASSRAAGGADTNSIPLPMDEDDFTDDGTGSGGSSDAEEQRRLRAGETPGMGEGEQSVSGVEDQESTEGGDDPDPWGDHSDSGESAASVSQGVDQDTDAATQDRGSSWLI